MANLHKGSIYSDQVHAASDPQLHQQISKSAPTFQLDRTTVVNPDSKEQVITINQTTQSGSLTHRPLLNLVRHPEPGKEENFASVRFRTMRDQIELTIHNHSTLLHEQGRSQFRYFFVPTCDPRARWCWAESSGGLIFLVDENKNEQKIASITRGLLRFEDEYDAKWVDDVVVSAIAVYYKNEGMDVGDSKLGEKIEGMRTNWT